MSNYYDDDVQTQRKPTRQELKAENAWLKEQLRQDEEQAYDTIREIRVALGEETEGVKTCTHRREDGRRCRSIAVKDRDFCPFHLEHRVRRLRMERARARRERQSLQLPPLEDLYAVQVGIMQVLDWLVNGRLERRDASVALCGLRQAATNLARPPEVWEKSRPFQNQRSGEQMALPGFEAELGLPQGFDLNTPPEAAFPETAPAALSEDRINLMEVTPTDIELMEIRQREGTRAVWQRLKQLDAAEDRRYKKAQKQLAHARHVVRAAAQNAARETVFEARSEAARAAAEAAEKAAAASAADAPPLTASVADDAPPLAASGADRVDEESGRKEPRSAVTGGTEALPAEKLG